MGIIEGISSCPWKRPTPCLPGKIIIETTKKTSLYLPQISHYKPDWLCLDLSVTGVNYQPRAAFLPHYSPLYALLHSQVPVLELWLHLHRRRYFNTCQNPWFRTRFPKQCVWAWWLQWITETLKSSPRGACHGCRGGGGCWSGAVTGGWFPSLLPTPAGLQLQYLLWELSPGPVQEG